MACQIGTYFADVNIMKTFSNRYFLTFLLLTLIFGCVSKLTIQSDPPQADLFASIEGKEDKQKLGQTPLELSEFQLLEVLKLSPESTSWIELTFSKENFQTKNVVMPSSRFGEMKRLFKVKLRPMEENSTVVTKMMRLFFNAKKFAESKQYEDAHGEVDKIIAQDAKIPQAFSMKAGIYFLQGNLDMAKEYYTKAIEIDPSFAEAITMLEKIKNKKGGAE